MVALLDAMANVPASDLERARRFYADKLGLTPTLQGDMGYIYTLSGGSSFLLYETMHAGTAQHTVMSLSVDNLDSAMADLRSRGIVFEEYDLPGLKTVYGVAEVEGRRGAWFKDSEGNIIAIGEFAME